jgi:acyl-[acyl-carrier-protein]-phospholipid O-acyltransferase / long-chain-fatty-acid--[acyl-carrier-protein] ligase
MTTNTRSPNTGSSTAVDRTLNALLLAQFCGAFNDNAFKMIVALLAIGAVAGGGEAAAQEVTTVAFVVFTLPLLVGSLPAMVLGDRIGKRALIVGTKFAEVLLMAAGAVALCVQPAGVLPFVVLAAMGLQSALFAPGKYGILPETLPHERLSAANGKLEAASFVAIVLGTVAGGALLAASDGEPWLAGLLLTAVAVVGAVASLRLPRLPAAGLAGTERESAAATVQLAARAVRSDRVLRLATLGTVAFWGLASLLGQDVLVYAKQVLGFDDRIAGLPFGVFAIGVGAGSLLAGRIANGKVETGLIPLGALGLAGATLLLGLSAPGLVGTLLLMAALGVASGFVVVPLNALVQWRAPAARRGAVIAFVNLLSFAGILAGNFGCLLLSQIGLDSRGILVAAAALTIAGTVWALWLLPEALVRLVVVLATHGSFRVRLLGRAHVPEDGAALLVPNHVSFFDGLFLLAAIDRPVRFLVEQRYYEKPWLRPFLQALGAIPIAGDGGPRVVLRALRHAGEALDRGELVCLFAEGEITRMGSTLPFRRGFARLLKGRTAPVVPVHIDRPPGGLGARAAITLSFGAPVAGGTDPAQLRLAVERLGADAAALRSESLPPLHAAVVAAARRAPFRPCLADSDGRSLRRLPALAAAVALAPRLVQATGGAERIGTLLPPSIAAALVEVATSLAGRAAVPLNPTIGSAAVAAAIAQAGLGTVVTARAVLERLPWSLSPSVTPVFVEDLLRATGRRERAVALLRALCWPRRWLERACGASRRVRGDDVAAILFSSGSSGAPKGVVLRHRNIAANCDAVARVLPLTRRDRLVGVLPLFHSFGKMALWYALRQGAGVVFHPDPRDAAAVGALVAQNAATVLLGTPTFLSLYLRRVEPAQFGSLRIVLAGAEKLTDGLADAFEERFGLRPLQGYGATECAPAIAVGSAGFRGAGFCQRGARRGSVGRPLPGVAVRIVDPETRRDLPIGAAGLVLVRGPNVMAGYLDRPEATAAAFDDGYYVTGDVGRLDDDGFLFLTDRLARFAKIGGEMVPLSAVEEHLMAAHGMAPNAGTERAFVVCAVPDAKKGERLAVLTTLPPAAVDETLSRLRTRDLPPLFVPRREHFVTVDALPLLGSGKVDLVRARAVCQEAAGAGATANG